ncbi:MAG: phosphoglycerate kinase, partial [Armatimonadetes bacterium]|nr:phosphoglycerate kinase [Armatimonadota bacterium]
MRTLTECDVQGRRVLIRLDLNVPQDKAGAITDETRIRAVLPTLEWLIQQGARIAILSHLGRPKGVDDRWTLAPIAARLAERLGRPVGFAADCVGPVAEAAVNGLAPGQVVLLENVRFHPEEEQNDPTFAAALARHADLYVNDAFGTAHRAHASTEGVARLRPNAAGFLMGKELEKLGSVLHRPEHPFITILGGSKVSDKIGVIQNLLPRVQTLLIGGAMAFAFIKARGGEIGRSKLDPEDVPLAAEALQK